jgi:hypothetical protein
MEAIIGQLWCNANEAARGGGGDFGASNQALKILIGVVPKELGAMSATKLPATSKEERERLRLLLSSYGVLATDGGGDHGEQAQDDDEDPLPH